MKFPKEDLQDLAYGEGNGIYELIEDSITSNGRWSIHHKMIFKHEDKFYTSNYSVGATESQDEGPYEYDSDEVECKEVFPKEKVITVYE